MSAEIARKLIENLDKNIEEQDLGCPHFIGLGYDISPLSKENFRSIKQLESSRKIAFLDGGNQEILGAPNFSVQFNRVYFNIFEAQERVPIASLPNRIEFFSTTHSCFRDDEIYYDTTLFPLRDEYRDLLPYDVDLSFGSSDRTIMMGIMQPDISRVASIARRFAEWAYVPYIIKEELEVGDIIVLDGSLQTVFTNEPAYFKRLCETAKSNGVIVTGLSKTSRTFTDTGLSLLGAVGQLAEEIQYGSWYYRVAEAKSLSHNAVIYVVKLTLNAERIFRFEIYREQLHGLSESDIDEIFSQLAKNSRDIAFPGYPYGLVDADRLSRVRNDEARDYQVLLLSEISKRGKWSKFARHIRAVDAHSILNTLMG